MALGVLNNLSAIYAENNLNNTSNSLQTVYPGLSSLHRAYDLVIVVTGDDSRD
jgi:hypothetical protein